MLSDKQVTDAVITYLRNEGPTSRRELNKVISSSPNRLKGVLEAMRDAGTVERVGERVTEIRWRFTPKFRREALNK